MKRTAIVSLMIAIASAVPVGCRRQGGGDAASARRESAKVQLEGEWIRQWEFGPVVHQLILNPDGSMAMREYRAAVGSASSAPAAPTMHHRHYDRDVPLATEATGTWKVQDGNLICQTALSNGDPLILRYRIERQTGSELVLSAAGIDARTDFQYKRRTQ